jgi:hypothetical protein
VPEQCHQRSVQGGVDLFYLHSFAFKYRYIPDVGYTRHQPWTKLCDGRRPPIALPWRPRHRLVYSPLRKACVTMLIMRRGSPGEAHLVFSEH